MKPKWPPQRIWRDVSCWATFTSVQLQLCVTSSAMLSVVVNNWTASGQVLRQEGDTWSSERRLCWFSGALIAYVSESRQLVSRWPSSIVVRLQMQPVCWPSQWKDAYSYECVSRLQALSSNIHTQRGNYKLPTGCSFGQFGYFYNQQGCC